MTIPSSPLDSPTPSAAMLPTAPTTMPLNATRYAPSAATLAREREIRDEDVLAVLDARGGGAYAGSVDTGLANRFPFLGAAEHRAAVARALKSGAVVRTPMGVLRRPPTEGE